MPTSTVKETQESGVATHSPPLATPAPNWGEQATPPVVRRRRRRSRGRSALRWCLRILAAAIVALAFLILFAGTAESQSSGTTADGKEATGGAKRPDSIEDWVKDLTKKNPGTPPASGATPVTRPVTGTPQDKTIETSPKRATSTPGDLPKNSTDPKSADPKSTDPKSPPPGSTPESMTPKSVQPSAATSRPGQSERVRPSTTSPRPRRQASPETELAPIDFAGKIRPLSKIPSDELPWTDTLELLFSLEKDFSDHAPMIDLGALRRTIYDHLIALSVTLDHNDNPRENLDELRAYLEKVLALRATRQTEASLDRLLPRTVLPNRRGSPVGVALIALVLSDLVSKFLELEPVLAGDQLGLRYRSGMHRYILIPTTLDRLYSDREFLLWATGQADPKDQRIRTLTRREFWGMVMAEAGAGVLVEGHTARAADILSRSIELFPDLALPHIATARILVSMNDIETAREELDLAVKLEPNNATARFERAAILETLGDSDTLATDLRWLTHEARSPLAAIKLIHYYLNRSLFRDAEREYASLAKRDLPPSMAKELAGLELAVGAAPWIARLRHSSQDKDRFEAIDALTKYPTRDTLEALIATLEDDNIRLGTYAHKALRELANMDLPKVASEWSKALERLPRK